MRADLPHWNGKSVPATVAVIIPTLNSPTLGEVIAAVQAQVTDSSAIDLVVVGRDEPGRLSRLGRGTLGEIRHSTRRKLAILGFVRQPPST